PVRTAPDPGALVVDWLRDLQNELVESRRYEHLPLNRVQSQSGLPGDTPLFDSIVVFENYPVDEEAARRHGVTVESMTAREATNYALTLIAYDGPAIDLRLRYDPALFDVGTVQRLLKHLSHLVDGIVAAPDRRLAELDLLDGRERDRVEAWGDGGTPQRLWTIPDLFSARVAQRRDATALVTTDREWTWTELDERVSVIARRLVDRGVGTGDVVGVHLQRGPELVAAFLGIMRAGATYLPIDPNYPQARRHFIARDSGASLVLVGADPVESLPEDLEQVPVADLWDVENDACGGDPVPPGLDDLAYLIYTSGSTGTPKGTMVTHRGAAELADSMTERFATTEDTRVLQLASPSFDASVMEVLMALGAGAPLVLPEPGPLVGDDLAEVLLRERIGLTIIPPSLLASVPEGEFPDLRTLVVGAEACTEELVRRWSPGRRMVNAYGPTEITIAATLSDPLVPERTPPIGRPVVGTRL
ncbi:AMP-binding protein, partial [Nocardiopsis listeri]|uniref:AMP-binding protein n=1 Tax=Nocardiopsis listeri TaxID=53440 RepID=UPI000ADBF525